MNSRFNHTMSLVCLLIIIENYFHHNQKIRPGLVCRVFLSSADSDQYPRRCECHLVASRRITFFL